MKDFFVGNVVMISSTARDLPEHRRQVLDACLTHDFQPRMMEHLPASDADAVEASLRMVDDASVYVGIFAHRYGYVPSGHAISVTEMEYNRAVERGMPRLLFFMHDDHPLRAGDVETGAGADKLKTFKERLGKERVAGFFTSPADLRAGLISSLVTLREQAGRVPALNPPPRPHYRDEFTRDLGERLDELLETECVLRSADASPEEIQAVVSQALALKRQLREGPQLQAGDWLSNRYRLLKELGSGGFATVWHAFDKKRKHAAAVKVLHGQHSDSAERLGRFRRGARIMDQLTHPNIVRILERDQMDGGYHYFAMEYVAGGTFAQAVTSSALTVEKRIEVVLQVGAALVFAHQSNILHRDVTPDNILLDAAGGLAKLTDFDLVRVADSTGGTRTGALGKFIYAAPESMESADDSDVQCDVYSLGMTAVFSFHGKKLSARDLMYNRVRFMKDLDCPRKIKTVLARATEPDRDERFATMTEFRTALQDAIAVPPSGKREGESPAEPQPLARPEPRPLVVAAAPRIPSEFVNSIGMKFVLIPPGVFLMGSPKGEGSDHERPQHEVEITRPFYLGVHPVTQAQWRAVMGNNPSCFSATGGGKDRVKGMNTDDFPVERVSWGNVVDFLNLLSAPEKEREAGRKYRLPGEAEWEYSCRGGAASFQTFHFGNSLSSNQANFDGNLNRTCKVGSYEANAFGLYDMHGNVWEWCADWYDKDYYGKSPRCDPAGPLSGSDRVSRGGSWDNQAEECAASDRYWFEPGYASDNLGFRLLAVPSGQ